MTTKLFSEAISEVGDKYYEEAANYHCKKHGWIKWSAMAACFIEQLCDQVYLIEDCQLLPITEEIAARYREME